MNWTSLLLLVVTLVVRPLAAVEPTVEQSVEQAPATSPFISDDDWQAAGGESAAAAPSMGGSLVRLAGTLLVLVLLLAVAAWLAKRGWRRRSGVVGGGRHLRLLETLPLGVKRAVSLVQLGDQVLVVGQTEQQINHLTTVSLGDLHESGSVPSGAPTAPDAEVAPAAASVPAAERRQGFQQRLREVLGR